MATAREDYIKAMDDDFNTADALAVLFALAREGNTYLSRSSHNRETLVKLLSFYQEVDRVLGLFGAAGPLPVEEKVRQLIETRQKARENKDFATADRIREELKQSGVILEDTPQGPRWRFAAE